MCLSGCDVVTAGGVTIILLGINDASAGGASM